MRKKTQELINYLSQGYPDLWSELQEFILQQTFRTKAPDSDFFLQFGVDSIRDWFTGYLRRNHYLDLQIEGPALEECEIDGNIEGEYFFNVRVFTPTWLEENEEGEPYEFIFDEEGYVKVSDLKEEGDLTVQIIIEGFELLDKIKNQTIFQKHEI